MGVSSPPVVCPWFFVDSNSPIPAPITHVSVPKPKTFAVILTDGLENSVTLSQLLTPTIRGDYTYVKIREDIYQEQIKSCRTNLLGSLLLKKGTVPMKTADLKASLVSLWSLNMPWRLVPIGKGYYDFHFSTEDNMRRILGWRHLYYARILVDVDLSGELPASIMVERENHGLPVEIVYENLPSKCGHYSLISHDASQCHQLQKQNQTQGRSLSKTPTHCEYHPMNRVNDATKAIGTTQQNIDGGPMIPAASNGISALPRPNDDGSTEVDFSGPPPGFEHRNETDLGVEPADVIVNIDAMIGMTPVLSKSQKRRMRKKTHDSDLRPEPIETRARSAFLRPSS
ncbi:hypothetical protein ACFX13_013594 [Malus domestica]